MCEFVLRIFQTLLNRITYIQREWINSNFERILTNIKYFIHLRLINKNIIQVFTDTVDYKDQLLLYANIFKSSTIAKVPYKEITSISTRWLSFVPHRLQFYLRVYFQTLIVNSSGCVVHPAFRWTSSFQLVEWHQRLIIMSSIATLPRIFALRVLIAYSYQAVEDKVAPFSALFYGTNVTRFQLKLNPSATVSVFLYVTIMNIIQADAIDFYQFADYRSVSYRFH